MKKVSIIVPIYNGEKYIKQCIDSLINQSLKEIEIILINDGSTDNTKNIIENYSEKDKRIIVINKENSGPGSSRNIGINKASGEYIGFVDSDDYVEKTMYKDLYNLVKNQDIDICMCNYKDVYIKDNKEYVVNHRLNTKKVYKEIDIKKEIVSKFSLNENIGLYSLCNKIYRRDFLKENKLIIPEEREHGEDWLFNINAFTKAKLCKFIDTDLYNYVHINDNSLMNKYREEQFNLCLDGRRNMFKLIPEEFINKKELDERFIYEFSSYIINTFNNIPNQYRQKELIYNVLNNKEVIDSCVNNQTMPIHFKLTTSLIRKSKIKMAYLVYRLMWVIKYREKRDKLYN